MKYLLFIPLFLTLIIGCNSPSSVDPHPCEVQARIAACVDLPACDSVAYSLSLYNGETISVDFQTYRTYEDGQAFQDCLERLKH